MSKHKYIETPEKLWEYWEEYKASVGKVSVPVTHPKLGVVDLEIPEPIHERGFSLFMEQFYDLGTRSIHAYFINVNNSYDNYHATITRIKDDTFTHNYKYSVVGLHKEKLTMSLLGMANKVEESGQKTFVIKDDTGNTPT